MLKILFSHVPERFFAHSLAPFGSDIPSIRQVTHRKLFSWNDIRTGPIAEALHEQELVNLKESILYSGQEKVAVEGTTVQYKSFKLLRIANSRLQSVKEHLRSVQIKRNFGGQSATVIVAQRIK